METFTKGTVVVVPFPYSDLSHSKTRPALVLGCSQHRDLLLCQITSKALMDPVAIRLTDSDFQHGSLHHESFVRPTKLFTASQDIVVSKMGILQKSVLQKVIASLVRFLTE